MNRDAHHSLLYMPSAFLHVKVVRGHDHAHCMPRHRPREIIIIVIISDGLDAPRAPLSSVKNVYFLGHVEQTDNANQSN